MGQLQTISGSVFQGTLRASLGQIGRISAVLSVSVAMIMALMAYLHNAAFAPTSIISTISVIYYFHKLNGFPDPAKNVMVAKLLTGAHNLRTVSDVRLPVTLLILHKLIAALPHVVTSNYKRVMLRAMMILAFRAYLRVGEMVPRSRRMFQDWLQLSDLALNDDLITVSFRHFKHRNKQGPQSLQIDGQRMTDSDIYPAAFLREFLMARGTQVAPLFAYADGFFMLRREFDVLLKRLLVFSGFSAKVFKAHSFRIGAATSAALRGESDAQLRAAGRWASDAFRKYIRIA